jgi:hypothetical protein
MNTIEIPCILWKTKSVGVALHKLVPGENKILVTAKNKDGDYYYPLPIVAEGVDLIGKYGVEVINKKGLRGVWLPLDDFFQNEGWMDE